MKQKCSKVIRVVTVPPVFALLLCTILYWTKEGAFASAGHCLAALCFLSFLPILSYPLCAIVPALRKKGRRAERNLGLIFSVAGYIGGMLFCFLTDSTPIEKLIYATYFFSGVGLAVCTLLHFKASGHTCGCSGPIMVLSVLLSPWFLLGYVLLGAIMWASRSLERHSVAQLVGGSLVPVLMLFLCMGWVM